MQNVLNSICSVLVYRVAPPEETVLRAAYQLLARYPILAGRFGNAARLQVARQYPNPRLGAE